MDWCELVQCLDKASINFIRVHMPDGLEAWKAIVGKHRSTERLRIQTLLTQLAGLKMAPGEKVTTDYLPRAERIQLNHHEAGEMTSNALFSAMVSKGLPTTFDSIATVLKFGPRKGYEEMKQDLINFANTRAEPGTDVASTAFHSSGGNSSRKITCLKCQKESHMARDCRSEKSRACFKCNAKGHLARDCKSKKVQSSGTSRGPEKQCSFSFRSFEGASEEGGLELLDSGCNGFMLKVRTLLKELDEKFNPDVVNANGSRTRVECRGTARCGVLDSKGTMCELELKEAFWVAIYTRNLISVKKLAEQGARVSFGKEANIRTQDGSLLPLVCTSDDLYTLLVLPFVCNLGPRALPVDRLPGITHRCGGCKGWSHWLGSHAAQSRTLVQWHRALGHNNFKDVARLTKLLDGMQIRKDGASGHCDACAEEKPKSAPVNKASGTRAKKLDLVYTDVLGPIHQESYEGFRSAIGFIDSYSRYVPNADTRRDH